MQVLSKKKLQECSKSAAHGFVVFDEVVSPHLIFIGEAFELLSKDIRYNIVSSVGK